MFVNSNGENIVFNSKEKNNFFCVNLAGQTNPNDKYRIMHNVNKYFLYDSYVFEYVISGKGYIEYDEKRVSVEAGDMYFLNKLQRHIYYSDSADPYVKIFIVISGALVDKLVEAYNIKESVIVKKINIQPTILKIHDLLTKPTIDYNQISIEILKLLSREELINICYKLYNDSLTNEDNTKLSLAELIKAHLDNNIAGKINLEHLSRELHISKSHIERVFKDSYGISPLKYFINRKVDYACAMLINTKYSVSKISEQLSFCDDKYFSKCIKRNTGLTPLQYRKQNRKFK